MKKETAKKAKPTKAIQNRNKALILWAAFLIFTVLIKIIDVEPVGPNGSKVGWASLNCILRDSIGLHEGWYKLTQVLGYFALLLIAFFGIIGVMQLIKWKSLLKVDVEILVLGAFYVLVGICYLLFEVVVINYRPFILDAAEGLEASYPSSHTVLGVCVFISALAEYRFYIKDKSLLFALQMMSILMTVLMVLGRIISGVHWFTDIIGGVLLSAALVTTFVTVFNIFRRKKKKAKDAEEPELFLR